MENGCSGRSRRSRAPVYYKEDSFVEDVVAEKTLTPVTPITPRRGNRVRKKTAVAAEADEEASKRLNRLTLLSDDELETPQKPTDLFSEDDVEGKRMFGFKVSHRKKKLLQKAIQAAIESPSSTPGTPKRRGRPPSVLSTPKSVKILPVERTPHHIRKKLTKKLQNIFQSDSEGTDFSDSGTDFEPSDSSQHDDSIESDESDEKLAKATVQNAKPYGLRTRADKHSNFFLKSDDYFTMQGSKKIVTSNRTLDRLKNPRMTEDKLLDILKARTVSKEHRAAIEELVQDHHALFNRWLFALSEGFSVLLYGVGSKIKLLQEFQQKKLSSHPVVVVNGFFPGLTLKDLLESIIVETLDSDAPSNINEAISLVEERMRSTPSVHLFIVVHNIDGPMLKNHKAQHALSKLTRIPNVHLMATLDHVNGPLVWDHMKLRDYNFSWWDVTTFLPYTQETSFESSLMVHKSGALALSSLQNVFHSLTTNAKGIFMLIAKNQLKNKKTPHYQGISFKDLYWSARESFLASSDLALRAQLTEFLDHKLVKNKRTPDGIENLIIPIENGLLQQFIDQNRSD